MGTIYKGRGTKRKTADKICSSFYRVRILYKQGEVQYYMRKLGVDCAIFNIDRNQ